MNRKWSRSLLGVLVLSGLWPLPIMAGQSGKVGPTGGSTASVVSSPAPPAPLAAGTDYMGPNSNTLAIVDPNYQNCGQDCHYQKANENISLQADYILKKINFLISDYASDEDKIKLLGSFYRAGEEDVEAAIARYVRMNRFWFVKVRSALGNNQESYKSVHCSSLSADGNTCLKKVAESPGITRCSVTSSQGACLEWVVDPPGYDPGQTPNQPNRPNKMVQTPYFSKFDQLKLQQSSLPTLASVQDGSFDEPTLQNYKPNENDFIRFKKIFKDPSNPAAGEFEVPETGEKRFDKPAYQRALAAWNDGQFIGDAKDTVVGRKNLGALRARDKQVFKTDTVQNGKSPTRQIYDEARGQYVEEINQYISQQNAFNSNSNSVSFQGKPPPDKVYTGQENVLVPATGNGSQSSNSTFYDVYSPNAFTGTVFTPAGQVAPPAKQEDFFNPFF